MICIHSAGGFNQLQYRELSDHQYTQSANIGLEGISIEDCVTIDTHACGVNYADVCIRLGIYKSATEFVGWPITPGFEFSGIIRTVGKNVTNFKEGDKVFGLTLFGAYSQRILVPSNQIHKLPENISLSEAAAVLCTGATAWYAVYEVCKLRKGDVVLVHSAAGGVGTMLVQLLKRIGCEVVGVVGGTHKVETVQQLGCDHVIDKSKVALWDTAKTISPRGYKAVFDANGVETLQESYNHLSPGGRLVSYGFATMLPRSSKTSDGTIGMLEWIKIGLKYKQTPSFSPLEMTTSNKSVMAFNLSFMFNETALLKECVEDLYDCISNGLLRVPKVTEYDLANAGEAHRDIQSGNTIGKLVLLTKKNTLILEQ